VSWHHLQTILWLRWRLRVNQFKRAGTLNAILLGIFAFFAVLLAIGLFIGLFFVGLFGLNRATPTHLLYLWDSLAAVFLFSWAIGLLTELQRAEALSLEKFLHFPVSLTGAFLVNYISSLASFSLLVFVPASLGLALGLVFSKGAAGLLVFPLLAAFVLMVTALTYQFQGWLASLMVNKRRRRTIIVVVTAVFIVLCQVPTIININRPWEKPQQTNLTKLHQEEQAEMKGVAALEGTADARIKETARIQQKYKDLLEQQTAETKRNEQEQWRQFEQSAWVVNVCVPIGWLPIGAMAAAEGSVLPALLGTLGLTLLGAASLWRSYRTTLRLYTAQFSSGKRRPRVAVPAPVLAGGTRGSTVEGPVTLVERKLPWMSEHAAAIAVASFRALTRAPEVKMLLLSPIIMVVVFGGILLRQPVNFPDAVRPLLAFGAMSTMLMTMVQLIGNQFGFDRGGFRVFVLCAASRRDILLGKNLAAAPLALGMCTLMVGVLQAVYPMRIDFFLALLPQILTTFLLFCCLANFLSILTPLPVASGSLKATGMKGTTVLIHMAFVFLFPLVLAPTLLPLGLEVLLDALGLLYGVPLCLLLSLGECVAVVYLYRLVLTWQGNILQGREKKILEIVTPKAE
jgi:hypothetical protein